jgi:acetyl/propionyl-CoA carboxylase alpha subunit
MLKAIVDGVEHDLHFKDGIPTINGGLIADIFEISQGKTYHLLLNNKSYFIEILAFDTNLKKCNVKVNNKTIDVDYKDRYDLLLNILGIDDKSGHFVNNIKAPMPGLVLKVLVEKEQTISKGDPVIVLEAMKMENIIKSPGDGKVKSIVVTEKQAVDKNQILLELE